MRIDISYINLYLDFRYKIPRNNTFICWIFVWWQTFKKLCKNKPLHQEVILLLGQCLKMKILNCLTYNSWLPQTISQKEETPFDRPFNFYINTKSKPKQIEYLVLMSKPKYFFEYHTAVICTVLSQTIFKLYVSPFSVFVYYDEHLWCCHQQGVLFIITSFLLVLCGGCISGSIELSNEVQIPCIFLFMNPYISLRSLYSITNGLLTLKKCATCNLPFFFSNHLPYK